MQFNFNFLCSFDQFPYSQPISMLNYFMYIISPHKKTYPVILPNFFFVHDDRWTE